MPRSLEFILGLLDRPSPACVSQDDFEGEHGPALCLWQRLGFLSREPETNPVPSCPCCFEGTLSRLGGRCLCLVCLSPVDHRHFLLWRFDLEAFLAWLARKLALDGGVRPVGENLWQLGSFYRDGLPCECFFRRAGPLSDRDAQQLLARRNALLLRALPRGELIVGFRGPCLSLLDVLRQDRRTLMVADLAQLLHGEGAVRFDEESGAVWAGDVWLGEVPVASKEFHFLACLADHLDRFVPYADLKYHVLRQTGSKDGTEEATFCHKLKRRIKEKRWVPEIDRLLATTNKGDGYRLRGHVGR